MVDERLSVLGIDGSPGPTGKTYAALEATLLACSQRGTATSIVRLQAVEDYGDVIGHMGRADAIVFGAPVYRGSFAWPLKVLLDQTTRDRHDDGPAVLRGKAVAIVLTSGSAHHFLAVNDLRNVLAGFFAAHVVPPGLAIPADAFDAIRHLNECFSKLAQMQGAALVELAGALRASDTLRTLEPQI